MKTKSVKRTASPKLHFFDSAPAGKLLRAYFIALITAQTKTLKSGATFKLWPKVNVSGHTATGKLKRTGGLFSLTAQGVSYFSDPAHAPDAQLLKDMLKAVKTGTKPNCFKHTLIALK